MPMDYDNNDFQDQKLQVAGEESSKYLPVLQPYALPKFDFDDNLHGHLRFANLVETEVFLGIGSQEDNNWIEDFSRGSSGIEFNSSAAESCSISRRNNVWSEATSSESVEMLLKSVGQEEMIPGESIIKGTDGGCELIGFIKQEEPSLKQDINSEDGNTTGSVPILPPDKFLESLSYAEGAKEIGSSNCLGGSAIYSECSFSGGGKDLLMDEKCRDASQREFDSSYHESLVKKPEEDSFALRIQEDTPIPSGQDIFTTVLKTNDVAAAHLVDDSNKEAECYLLKGEDGSKKQDHLQAEEVQMADVPYVHAAIEETECNLKTGEDGGIKEGHLQTGEIQMDDQTVEREIAESGSHELENPVGFVEGHLQAEEVQMDDVHQVHDANEATDCNLKKGEDGRRKEDHLQTEEVQMDDQNVEGEIAESGSHELENPAGFVSGATYIREKNDAEKEDHLQTEEVQTSDHNVDGGAAESGCHELDNPLSLVLSVTSVVEENAAVGDHNMYGALDESSSHELESPLNLVSRVASFEKEKAAGGSVSNLEEPSNIIAKENSDLPMMQGCIEPTQQDINLLSSSCNCEEVMLSNDVIVDDLLQENTHARSNVTIESSDDLDDKVSEVVGISNFANSARLAEEMDSTVPMDDGLGKTSEEKENLEGTCDQRESMVLVTKCVPSLLSPIGNNLIEGPIVESSSNYILNVSNSEVDGSMEIPKSKPETEKSGVSGAFGVGRESLGAKNLIAEQSEVSNRTCSITKKEKVNLSLDSGDADRETVGSLTVDARVGLMSSGEGSTKKEVILCQLQCDATGDNKPGDSVTCDRGSDDMDEGKLPVTSLDTELGNSQHDMTEELSPETALQTIDECSKVVCQRSPVYESGNGAFCELDQKLVSEGANMSTVIEVFDAKSQNYPLEVQNGKPFQGTYEQLDGRKCDQPSLEVAGLNSHLYSASDLKCGAKAHILERECNNVDSDNRRCVPTIIGDSELNKSKVGTQRTGESCLDHHAQLPEIRNGALKEVFSLDPEENGSLNNEKDFPPKTSSLADCSPVKANKGQQTFSRIQTCNMPEILSGSPPASGLGQREPMKAHEFSRGSFQASDSDAILGDIRGTPELKTRRTPTKTAGKDSAKKGKESSSGQTEKLDKLCTRPPNTSATCQLMQCGDTQRTMHAELNSKKSSNIITPSISVLPDLNSSASLPAVFQQPFTDLQQVQLRAQIFVYGSLIQGTAPDEACMISAFGGSGGGRSTWDDTWRASVERLCGQKANSSGHETHLQPRSDPRSAGHRVTEQANKQGSLHTKVHSSPVGHRSGKSTPSPVANSKMPPSSPLWTISTPYSDILPSSGIPRVSLVENPAIAPLHPYQTPTRNLIGPNSSWLTQTPFPGPWVASPQSSAVSSSARFPALPITEPVKLTPVRESSVVHASASKFVSPSPIIHGRVPNNVFGANSPLDGKKVMSSSPNSNSADPKPRKRKKLPVLEDLVQITSQNQVQTEPVSASHDTIQFSAPVPVTTPVCVGSEVPVNVVTVSSPSPFADKLKIRDNESGQKDGLPEDTLGKVKEAKLQAEAAAAHAAEATSHSQNLWNELDKEKNSDLPPDLDAKLAATAVAIAAAASVAKAAAAAAKVAYNVALQAKLMAEETLASRGNKNSDNINVASLSDMNTMRTATPASILKGGNEISSSSIFFAAREAARRRIEAATAASKQAENLDALLKAAELAAEAVTQAGKLVSMGDPLPLSELVGAGLESYWKASQVSSDPVLELNNVIEQKSDVDRVEIDPASSPTCFRDGISNENEMQEKACTARHFSSQNSEAHMRCIDNLAGLGENEKRDWKGQEGHTISELATPVGVPLDSEIGTIYPSVAVQNEHEGTQFCSKENSISQGSVVEVLREGNDFGGAWFTATVLDLKDGKAYVGYAEASSGDGSGSLEEWVVLEVEKEKPPRIRIPHPMSTQGLEGTRKRRRPAMGSYSWKVGDKVDAWMIDCWREGVITEKEKDEATFTVHFPAKSETSLVKAWHLRPFLIWKDGQWIEWCNYHEGDTPNEKRPRLASPPEDTRSNDKMSTSTHVLESKLPEESELMGLSDNEKMFNIGKITRNENKPDSVRTMRTGSHGEGSRVAFGVPKPGKKRKFMEVSKHYVSEKSRKAIEANDSTKHSKFLMPRGTGSHGWKHNSKADSKENRAGELKPRIPKSGKPHGHFSRRIAEKSNATISSAHDGAMAELRENTKDCASINERAPGKQPMIESRPLSKSEKVADGPISFSSLARESDDPSSKLAPALKSKPERANKGKLAPSGAKLAVVEEDKVYNSNSGKSNSEITEPRRSNRRIQPTSRLLEGLQSSLMVAKITSSSHDRIAKNQSRSASSRGNNHG